MSFSYLEMYQRRINDNMITNLMRGANMTAQAAEDKIRILFPVVRMV